MRSDRPFNIRVQMVLFCPEWFVVIKLVLKISEWDMCR